MIIDQAGARSLMASILKQALDDYSTGSGCPEWCSFLEACKQQGLDVSQCDAKDFIHSAWCAALCDGANVDYEEYLNVCITNHRLSKNRFKYVEREIRQYKDSLQELKRLKNDIILASPVKLEGKSNSIGNATANKAIQISMDIKIIGLEKVIQAIETAYNRMSPEKKVVMEEYWQERYTATGLASQVGTDERTIRRWKQQIVYSVAIELKCL